MNRSLLAISLVALSLSHPLPAQEDAAAKVEEAGRNIMSDPRLRNVLRSVKQDPAAAVDSIRQDPEEAVREATRIFQSNANGVDAETLKAAAAKAKDDGTLDRVAAKATEAAAKVEEAAMEKLQEEPAQEPPATVPVPEPATDSPPPAPAPVAAPVATPVEEVPATRPAPGIAGGEPAPVAMPVAIGDPEIPADDAPSTPRPPVPAKDSVVREARAEALPGSSPSVPELPDLGIDHAPSPAPLAKKYARSSSGGGHSAAARSHMDIRADTSVMDNAKQVILFTGRVMIDHPEFDIKCDKLEIQLADGLGMKGGSSSPGIKRAIASGGTVEIKRVTVDEKGKRKTQLAIARSADYNAITNVFVLSGGPPYIQDGDRFVKTNSPDAKIIMRGNGVYEIDGSTQHTIRIPIEPGKKGDNPFSGGLDGALGGRR